ncbi:hypothetical protein KCU62_g9823, partial [Aureobasidium sp. EXF-3399]
TADHDLDNAQNAAASETQEGIPFNVFTDISVYTGRGVLIESQGPTWLYGTASEHSQLYQYQLTNASTIYLGHMQTETPYYQPGPNALSPYKIGQFLSDPTFDNCADDSCRTAWALRVVESKDIFIYSAGFYSFFQNNQLGGNIQVLSPRGGLDPVFFNSTTKDGYTSEIAAWLALSTGGEDVGQDVGEGSGYVTIDPTIYSMPTASVTVHCIPPCTYVMPPLTLASPTTFNFPLLTTSLEVGWLTSSAGTTSYVDILQTTVITIPAVTASVIPVYDVIVTNNQTIFYLTPSIVPSPFNITDRNTISGTTHPPNTRTFYPPPWPGNTLPPDTSSIPGSSFSKSSSILQKTSGSATMTSFQSRTSHDPRFPRWTDRRSKDSGYWKVDATVVPELQSHIDEDSRVATAATAQDIEDQLAHDLAVMEAEEERRLAEEYDEEATGLDNELEHKIRGDWLRGCNWQDWFASTPRRLIVNVSRMPKMTLPAESLPLGTCTFVNGGNLESDAGASDVDQPLLPPSKRQRLTPSTSSNIIDESDATPIQPSRRAASTRGDPEELWSHARARRHGERDRERKKKIWYCFYGNRDCPRNYSTTNYDNVRSHLTNRHGWREATGALPRILARATPSQTSRTVADIDKARLNRRLIDLITSSNIPFRIASNDKLHALLDEVLPSALRLLIKTHYTVAKHVKKEHDFYQEQLKALLTTSRSLIHFTCDAWTANYGSHELLSITARFIASDGKLSKALLALYKLPSGHAGAERAPLFFDTIVNYGIKQKVGYITSDNATCNDTMMSHLATLSSERLSIDRDPIQHRTRCFGHQVNLASQALISASSKEAVTAVLAQSQDPLEAVSMLSEDTGLADHEAIDYLRQFFKWIMKSARRRREFKAAASVSAMLNNTIRWNS